MTLTDIKQYLSLNGSASLPELARHFNADSALIESMLDLWIRKGRVVLRHSKSCGSSCCGNCSSSSQGGTWYELVGRQGIKLLFYCQVY